MTSTISKYTFTCLLLLLAAALIPAGPATASTSADRAVQIARQTRQRVEQSGEMLNESSKVMFQAFAERSAELQKLIDTYTRLEKAGLLDKSDPDGKARRAHLHSRILVEVGELKSVCDENLSPLLSSLDAFDQAVADSLIDSQATRGINTNYELSLNQYISQERKRFDEAEQVAMDALSAWESATDPTEKNRLKEKYLRAKNRIKKIDQRRKLYETRVRTAAINQQITGKVRDTIRAQGAEVPGRFRMEMEKLYTVFAKIVPVAELGGTDVDSIMDSLNFTTLTQLNDTLAVVSASTDKLDKVLDQMVNDVLAGLDGIEIVDGAAGMGDAMSMEQEIAFLNQKRMAWK